MPLTSMRSIPPLALPSLRALPSDVAPRSARPSRLLPRRAPRNDNRESESGAAARHLNAAEALFVARMDRGEILLLFEDAVAELLQCREKLVLWRFHPLDQHDRLVPGDQVRAAGQHLGLHAFDIDLDEIDAVCRERIELDGPHLLHRALG